MQNRQRPLTATIERYQPPTWARDEFRRFCREVRLADEPILLWETTTEAGAWGGYWTGLHTLVVHAPAKDRAAALQLLRFQLERIAALIGQSDPVRREVVAAA